MGMPSHMAHIIAAPASCKIVGRQLRLHYRDTHYTSSLPRGSFASRTSMIVLTYLIETPGSTEALAAKIASDQSTGTFVELPGETPELKSRVAARVLAVRQLEPTTTPS